MKPGCRYVIFDMDSQLKRHDSRSWECAVAGGRSCAIAGALGALFRGLGCPSIKLGEAALRRMVPLLRVHCILGR